MVANKTSRQRAGSHEQLQPLVDLCKAGRLFDVQKWIDDGGPLDPPVATDNRIRKKLPPGHGQQSGFRYFEKSHTTQSSSGAEFSGIVGGVARSVAIP